MELDRLRSIAEDWERLRNDLLNDYCAREFDYDGVNCRYCVFRDDLGRMDYEGALGSGICSIHVMDQRMEAALTEEEAL